MLLQEVLPILENVLPLVTAGAILLLLQARPRLTLLPPVLRIPMLRVSDRSLPTRIPNDLGTLGPGMPRFPITDLQAPIWFIILLDPMARTLRRAQVVLQVLRV